MFGQNRVVRDGHKFWMWILRASIAATVLPLLFARHLPFCDLPEHTAVIATLGHWWDEGWRARDTFDLTLGSTQYVLYYVAGAALTLVLRSAERANVVLLCLVAIGFPLSLRALLRSLRRDERLCLFGCALFWTESLMIGFLPFVASVPVVIYGLALAIRQAEEPSRRRAFGLATLAVSIFYLHLCGFLFFVGGAVLCTALLPPPNDGEIVRSSWLAERAWRAPRRLLWLAPSLVFVAAWFARSAVVHPVDVGWTKPQQVDFDSVSTSLSALNGSLLDIWKSPYDDLCALGLAAAAAVILWPGGRSAEAAEEAWRRGVAAVLVTMAVVFYLAFPDKIGWLAYLNDRFSLFAALIVPCCLSSVSRARTKIAVALLALAVLGFGVVAQAMFRDFDAEVGRFDEVLASTRPGKRMLSLVLDRSSGVPKHTPYLHRGAYYRARYGGVLEPSFATLPQSPLRYKAETAPPLIKPNREARALDYDNLTEGPYYDYLLVRGSGEELLRRPQFAVGPQWRVLAREAHWSVLEKAPALRSSLRP